jgi:hypothetical protein
MEVKGIMKERRKVKLMPGFAFFLFLSMSEEIKPTEIKT